MPLITVSFKQACPHCNGDGFTVEPECCGQFNSNDFVDKVCCLRANPVQAQCRLCLGSGVHEFEYQIAGTPEDRVHIFSHPKLILPEWVFPEIEVKEFTL